MKVYISGKIGEDVISDTTREKFARAEKFLKSKGYEPFNPADENWQAHLKARYKEDCKTYQPYIDNGAMPDFYTYAILRDMMSMSVKNAVYMLEDWVHSPGAKSELAFACATGKDVFFESREHAVQYLESRWENGMNKTTISTKNEYVKDHIDEYWMPIV